MSEYTKLKSQKAQRTSVTKAISKLLAKGDFEGFRDQLSNSKFNKEFSTLKAHSTTFKGSQG